MRLER
jgi:hypothetical protein